MRIKRKPNLQLRKIVLEETNDGRDVVRFLKNVIVHIQDGPQTFGIRPQDFARTHKIAAARILARLGLEDGKRYLRRNYVPTPFRRTHPEDEDGPKRDAAAATSDLYRLVKKETKDGADIILYFVRIIKGLHPEYKPHLRMAAAKELIRHIEFDYEEPTTPTPEPTQSQLASTDATTPTTDAAPIREESTQESAEHEIRAESTPEPATSSEPNSEASTPEPATSPEPNPNPQPTNPVNPTNPINPDSDSDEITEPHISFRDFQRQMHIEDGSVHYRDYAAQYARKEDESIYQSIIRRASKHRNIQEAKRVAEELIGDFDVFMEERDPNYKPEEVPNQLIVNSLTRVMEDHEPLAFDPADYYELDRDYFYYCLCGYCEECDEVNHYFRFMSELAEEYEDP